MQRDARYCVIRRLLAATLALALVLASMVGSYAHTSDHGHHHDHASHLALDANAGAGSHADENGAPATSTAAADHTCCCDFLCHGGIAILADMTHRVRLDYRRVALTPRDDVRPGTAGGSLDRPPRTTNPA